VQHWQVASDYGNILHVNMVPFLVTSLSEDQIKEITIGAYRVVCVGSPDAWFKFCEHSGNALGAGRDELQRIEERMRVLAAEPLVERSGVPTATGRVIDEVKNQSSAQAWVRGLENALVDAFDMAATWAKVELPSGFAVSIFSDFNLAIKSADDLKVLSADAARGGLDKETYLREIKRRGLLAEATDIDEVLERIESEGAALAAM
jgi:hypothetical protein